MWCGPTDGKPVAGGREAAEFVFDTAWAVFDAVETDVCHLAFNIVQVFL